MRPWVAVAVAVVAVLILVPVVPAQSLAEVAARTKKKEAEKGKPPAKVYTESDLRGRPGAAGAMTQMEGSAGSAPASSASPSPLPAVDGTKPKTEEELRADKEAEWRARLQKANEEIARVTEEVSRAQTALNDISGPLYGGTRAGLIARVEEGNRQLAAARQLVEDLQEEGRRARFRQ